MGLKYTLGARLDRLPGLPEAADAPRKTNSIVELAWIPSSIPPPDGPLWSDSSCRGRHSLKPTLKGYFYTNLGGTLTTVPDTFSRLSFPGVVHSASQSRPHCHFGSFPVKNYSNLRSRLEDRLE
jgi:hypothetical protein